MGGGGAGMESSIRWKRYLVRQEGETHKYLNQVNENDEHHGTSRERKRRGGSSGEWEMAGAKMFAEIVNPVKNWKPFQCPAMTSCFRQFRDHYWMEYFAATKNDY